MAHSNRQRSCEERIGEYYAKTLEEIRKVAGYEEITPDDLSDMGADPDDYRQDPDDQESEIDQDAARNDLRETFEQDILSIDSKIVKRICFSWGGPADYIDIYIDPEARQIYRAVYLFQDWFDGAEREITGQDLDAVCAVFDWLTYEP